MAFLSTSPPQLMLSTLAPQPCYEAETPSTAHLVLSTLPPAFEGGDLSWMPSMPCHGPPGIFEVPASGKLLSAASGKLLCDEDDATILPSLTGKLLCDEEPCVTGKLLTGKLLCDEDPCLTGKLLSDDGEPCLKGKLLSDDDEPCLTGKLLSDEPYKRQRSFDASPLLLEEELSTDVGSATDASDAETTDNEFYSTNTLRGAHMALGYSSSRYHRHSSMGSSLKYGRKWGTMLETIIGTPVGTNAPLLFTTPPPAHGHGSSRSSAMGDASRVSATSESESSTNSVQAPPGLPSPVRTKRQRGTSNQSILATPAPSWEKRGARATQTLLATPSPADAQGSAGAGETAATPSYVSWLPVSPTKQARIAFMEKARQDGAPLKIHASFGEALPTQEFETGVPGKVGPLLEQSADSLAWVSKKVTKGEPAKKRVTPWLFAELAFFVQEIPR